MVAVAFGVPVVRAQDEKQVDRIVVTKPTGGRADADGVTKLSEVVVTNSALAEESPVGPYGQPDWTTERRFPTTRVYLQQTPWNLGFEQWVRTFWSDGDAGTHQRIFEEFELGLPHRFQLDAYEVWTVDKNRTTAQHEWSLELRYALADWGKIPLNPTLYYEYAFAQNDADVGEAKLLLGDDLAEGWHWGANISYEWRFGGDMSKEYMETFSIGKTIVDRKWNIGIEGLYASQSVKGERSNPANSLEIGPSIQWRPTATTHLDIVPLIGITAAAPAVESFIVFGYDFGRVGGDDSAPVSMRHR